MHEKRNFVLVLLLAGSMVWMIAAWAFLSENALLPALQRFGSLLVTLGIGGWLVYALRFEDKMADHLKEVVGEVYYEVDGLSFMPIVRMHQGRAELCVYYQNRFENPVQAIVHLRPPHDSFEIRPGMRDVHFAFRANGGDFGVIHQPIGVPDHLRGDVINVQLAAASYYPRSHGARLRKHTGIPCGSLAVDWGHAAFKTGVHEVSGEIELIDPVTLHLSMPKQIELAATGDEVWIQEQIEAGIAA